MSAPQPDPPENSRRLSDSPLFWFFVFGVVGLAALVVVAPKYARRQERLERMADSRQRLLTDRADTPQGAPDTATHGDEGTLSEAPPPDDAHAVEEDVSSTPSEPRPTLRLLPLVLFLAAVLAIAAVAVGTARYLRLAEARAAQFQRQDAPPPQDQDAP